MCVGTWLTKALLKTKAWTSWLPKEKHGSYKKIKGKRDPEEDIQANFNLPAKVTLQQKAIYGDNKSSNKDKGTSPIVEGDNNVNNTCREGVETLNRDDYGAGYRVRE